MLAGEMDSGKVLMPPLVSTRNSAILSRIHRQEWHEGIRNVVFFNLTSLDIPSIFNEESVNTKLRALAEEFKNIFPKVEV